MKPVSNKKGMKITMFCLTGESDAAVPLSIKRYRLLLLTIEHTLSKNYHARSK
jgi:hypothetical protein